MKKKELNDNYFYKISTIDNNIFDSYTEQHDKFNFEAKIDYKIKKNSKINEYLLSMYFFIPSSLQINEKTYSKKQFFNDIKNYIRFKTPQMAISGIINEKNNYSPLYKIINIIENMKDGKIYEKDYKKIIYELRLLGCIIKSSLQNQYLYIKKEYKKNSNLSELLRYLDNYALDLELFYKKMKKLKKDFFISQIPENVRQTFNFSYDYIINQTQSILLDIVDLLNEKDKNEIFNTKIIKIINLSQSNKIIKDFNPSINSKDNNEHYIYLEGVLKKIIQEVLYLNIKDKNEKNKTLQIFYAFAAGSAMLISLIIGIWIGIFFNQSSLPFIFLLVVAYILKDRIKDGFKIFFNHIANILFPDKKYAILVTNSNEKIGSIKETISFINKSEIPEDIIKVREPDKKSLIVNIGKPEQIIHFKRKVKINTKKIIKHHERHGNINDIIRFNIRNFIQYADDPERIEKQWNSKEKRIDKILCVKVYHLNVIMKLETIDSNYNKIISYKKVKVILNQNGIKNVIVSNG